MKRIHDSLHHVFLRNRIVFWYDSTGEWAQTFESFENTHVTKLTVSGNEFGTKVRIIRDCNPATKYLLYIPTARPIDAENWLLDLLLQGHEYKADRASLALQEVGLPYEFRYLAEEHAVFFKSTARTQSLKNLITKDDTAAGIRLKMMAVLTEEEMDVDTLLLHFLHPQNEGVLLDPVLECFDSSALTDYFWKEVSQAFGYASNTPSLLDFAVALFRSANPLDEQRTVLLPHAKVFIQRWQDSHKFSSSFRRWALQMEKELQVAEALSSLIERRNLGDCDTFEIL
jgi:hypothetical protein